MNHSRTAPWSSLAFWARRWTTSCNSKVDISRCKDQRQSLSPDLVPCKDLLHWGMSEKAFLTKKGLPWKSVPVDASSTQSDLTSGLFSDKEMITWYKMLSMSYTLIRLLLSGTDCGPMFRVSRVQTACWLLNATEFGLWTPWTVRKFS